MLLACTTGSFSKDLLRGERWSEIEREGEREDISMMGNKG